MPTEVNKTIALEIAHVLFIDIVGYSKFSINEQHAAVDELTQLVRATDQFQKADAADRLIKIATGDGMALVFYTTPEAPVRCAIEINRARKDHPRLLLRMGIHSGPVSGVVDVTGRANLAGAGLNMAHRVMDCGDAGHILLSKRVAEDLEEYEQWRPLLHDLGSCEVKHGVRVSVVSLYNDQFGNPKLPRKFESVQRRRARVRWAATVTGLLALAALVAGIAMFSRHRGRGALDAPEKSIAVLPFENLSGNPENTYFTDGIQEEILMRLAKIADLKVVSRTSTGQYKRSPSSLREIATQLGVANVLEGSVQRTADRVHVNVQLIKAASDAHLWAEAYDRKLTDIFAVESEIAKTIADTLQAKLTGSEWNAIAARPTENTDAHQLYLKGRYYWNRRTGENLKKALTYFEQATEKDPRYALAYAGIADSCGLISTYGAGTPQEYLPRARAAAQKAVKLDDTLAEAHTSLGAVFSYDFQYAQAAKEFERAISLNPNYATAHQWYGARVFSVLGEFNKAIAEEKRALELDPVSPIISATLGDVYTRARRYDEAIGQLRDTVEMHPDFYTAHGFLGWALELKGATDQAIAEYRKALELSDRPVVLAMLAHAEASIGKQNEARQVLARLNEEAKAHYVPAYAFAVIHLALGEKDRALDWLEKAARDHDGFYSTYINVDPYLDPLRGDPRFEALVSAILSGSVK